MQNPINVIQMSGKHRRSVACSYCRAKKIRCNGSVPCANCLDRAEECIMMPRRRSKAPRHAQRTGAMRGTSGGETSSGHLLAAELTRPSTASHNSLDLADEAAVCSQVFDQLSDPMICQNTTNAAIPVGHSQQGATLSQALVFEQQQQVEDDSRIPLHDLNLSQNSSGIQDVEDEDGSVYASDALNLEYYGPRSFLSFCSRPAVDWVISRVKIPGYDDIITRLITDLARMLKMNGSLSTTRAAELTPEVAWEYTAAYFDHSLDNAFGVVERSFFESRLRAHFSGTIPDDKVWYALRNALWACGCRILLSRTAGFREAAHVSWSLFENALSAHTDILFFRASMLGVQALILMAYYGEGLGKASLQYILCSNAMRLAFSKGLHRAPPRSWNLSPREIAHRSWMFWAIYCLEKQICTRSGRPSAIDDEEISCQVPECASSGQQGDTIYCKLLIETMQLSSSATRRLSSARSLQKTAAQVMDTVRILNEELEEMKISTTDKLALDRQLEPSQLLNGLNLRQAQSLQCHYFSLVLDINTPLTYPWSGIAGYAKNHEAAFAQVQRSLDAVSQVSRSAIIATRHTRIDPSCPALIAVYVPVYSFINLFIHVISGSNIATRQSDLLLLDVAFGYFSQLEFSSDGEISLPCIREICRTVHHALDQGNAVQDQVCGSTSNQDDRGLSSTHQPGIDPDMIELDRPSILQSFENDFLDWQMADDMEIWSTLLPLADASDLT